MPETSSKQPELESTTLKFGGARIESRDNPDAWIEVDYADNPYAATDGDVTDLCDGPEPFYHICPECREFIQPPFWGTETDRCPLCDEK